MGEAQELEGVLGRGEEGLDASMDPEECDWCCGTGEPGGRHRLYVLIDSQ